MKVNFIFFFFLIISLQAVNSQEETNQTLTEEELKNLDLLSILDISQNLHPEFNTSTSNSTCAFKTGHGGNCVLLEECQEITKFISVIGVNTTAATEFLRSRICKISENVPYFCCIPQEQPKKVILDLSIVPTMEECGFVIDDRIVLGDSFKHGQHPWLVTVGNKIGDRISLSCGGTLITRKHVISASHCFPGSSGGPSHVALGEFSLRNDTEEEPAIIMRIASRKSAGFTRSTFKDDIELLTLEREVNFTDLIRPACLPIGFENENFENITMTVAGWGATSFDGGSTTDTPLEAKLPVVSLEDCQRSYNRTDRVREVLGLSSSDDLSFTRLEDTQICAGLTEQDTCQGDSGGPLLYFDETNHIRTFLIGVTSFGVGCAHPEFPGIYTFVPNYMQWILENIQN